METGLYYLQSRYYDPTTMRFINADDPNVIQMGSTEKQELNLYAYCLNDPVNSVDPTGYDAIWINAERAVKVFGYKGHASLLIQKSNGEWYYFFWGPTDKNNIYNGKSYHRLFTIAVNIDIRTSTKTVSLKKLNSFLASKDCGLKINGGEKYTQYVYIRGNFSSIVTYYYSRIKTNRYNILTYNCAQVSALMLQNCLNNPYYSQLRSLINTKGLVPNEAIKRISSIFASPIRY